MPDDPPNNLARSACSGPGGIATVVIDNPPVNASSWDVRRGLLTAIEQMSADPSVSGIVLIGAGKTFIAGADIKEFDGPLRDPQMPAVIAAVEACAKPVVAAIHGAALGAGYELALGCDARIVAADAIVGLPEVMLGIIPGAGGTQRLPRLVGLSAAIDLITAGRRVKANEAVALGMVDAMSTGDLHADAVQLARSLQGRKRRLSELDVPAESDADIAAAADRATRPGQGRGCHRRSHHGNQESRNIAVCTGARRRARDVPAAARKVPRPPQSATCSSPSVMCFACRASNTQGLAPSPPSASSAPERWAPASPSASSMPGFPSR